MLRRFVLLNDYFAERAGQILSWSVWLTIMVVGTALWLIIHRLTHGNFDPGYTTLVLALTIQTALDAAATKLFQMALRRSDEKRERNRQEQIDAITELTVAIKDELDRSRERDEDATSRDLAAASRDDALRGLVHRLLDAVEERAEGGEAA